MRSVNVDSEFYHNLFCDTGGVYDTIERVCPWLRGTQHRIQQDGARPHTSEGEIEDLEAGCDGDGWSCIFITQPPNSPDTNLNDLGFFHSVKTMARQMKTHCESIEEMMDNVLKAFEEYPKEKITDIWACYFNNLRGIMSVDGGNDYKQAHNNSRNLIKTTGTPIDLRVDLEDYDRCFDLLNDV